jgi:hypothetical protein
VNVTIHVFGRLNPMVISRIRSGRRSIVEAHGGRLSAAANTPQGTVFLFSLPVNEPAL